METPTFLYKPNFCAECGEKIERESWHFWASRRFCDNCEPVYRLNRLLPPALAAIVLFFGGMFFDQMGQKPGKPPVVATQAALTAEKPLITAPKPPPQAQPAQNSAAEPGLPDNSTTSSVANPARTSSIANSVTQNEAVYTCGARTQKGTPCSRRVKTPGTRCWQHAGKPSMLEK